MPWVVPVVGRIVLGAGGRAVVGTGARAGATAGGRAAAAQGAAALGAGTLTAAQQAERLRKAMALAQTLAAAAANRCATGNCCHRTIVISRSRAPQSAQHIDDAQAVGYPTTLTYDASPSNARARRYQSTKGIPRVAGHQPDEYPPAAFVENGGHASVRNIPTLDNQIAGGIIGANLKGVPAGCRITIVTGP